MDHTREILSHVDKLHKSALKANEKGEFYKALEENEKSLELLSTLSDQNDSSVITNKLTLYNNMGEIHRSLEEYNSAQAFFDKALELYNISENIDYSLLSLYVNSGKMHESLGHLDTALDFYNKALLDYEAFGDKKAIHKKNLAAVYGSLGSLHLTLGNIPQSLQYHEMDINIIEKNYPNSVDLASSYGGLANVYLTTGDELHALKYFQKALNIRLRKTPDHPSVSTFNHNIGSILYLQKNYRDALDVFFKSTDFLKRSNRSSSIQAADTYMSIGVVYLDMGNSHSAKTYLLKALTIFEEKSPDSLALGALYSNMASLYLMQKDYHNSIEYMNKSLAIKENKVPNSLSIAKGWSNIAGVYISANESLDIALDYLKKAFDIMLRDLVEGHPALLLNGYFIYSTALKLKQYDSAVEYADMIIKIDYKYLSAYDIKGLALRFTGKYDEAIQAFDKALQLDPSFADARIHKLELITVIANTRDQDEAFAKTILSLAISEITEAQRIQASNTEDAYVVELAERASKQMKSVDVSNAVTLPSRDYIVGTTKYYSRLDELVAEIYDTKKRLMIIETKVIHVEKAVDAISNRLDILDTRVYNLAHSIDIVQRVTTIVETQLQSLQNKSDNSAKDDALIQLILREKEQLLFYEESIKEFNKNNDLRHYYQSVLSELEATYIAAQAVASSHVSMDTDGTYTKAANYLNMITSIIPLVGPLAMQLISGASYVIDTYQSCLQRISLDRMRLIASTVTDFDQIALFLSVELTTMKRAELIALQSMTLNKDWKEHVVAYVRTSLFGDAATSGGSDDPLYNLTSGSVEDMLINYLKENNTKAKLLGRKDALDVISYLQEEAVAENLFYESESANLDKYCNRNMKLAKLVLRELDVRSKSTSNNNSSQRQQLQSAVSTAKTTTSSSSPTVNKSEKFRSKLRRNCIIT